MASYPGRRRKLSQPWSDGVATHSGAARPSSASSPHVDRGAGLRAESQAVRITRLEAELADSRAEQRKLETERDTLRQAVKYFAGETNW